MIKAVIFDCFGVLTISTWQQLWASLPDVKLQETARELNRLYDRGDLTKEEFIAKLQAATGMSVSEMQSKLFSPSMDKNTALFDYIKTLKPTLKVGMLSNVATGWVREEFLSPQEQALFDDMVLSYEVRLAKPDPQIFQLACKRLGVQPHEAILVDDIERYCQAARAVGMHAIVYQNVQQTKTELQELLSQSE